jgi:iron complex transport system substrate-binding protein
MSTTTETLKRRLVPLVLAPLLLAACGTATTTGSAPPARTVTVTAANGEVTVPVTDTGIWALDYQSAINLLALGVVPSHAGRYTYDPDPYVKAAYAILERAGVKLVEPGNAEIVAAAEPELIVGRPNMGNDEIVPRLGAIAPVVTLPGLPVLEKELGTLGAVTGRADRAEALAGRLETKRAELARRVKGSEFAGASVSVLSACGADGYCVYGNARGFGPILADLGLARPAPQTTEGNEWGYENISPENLEQQKAEIVIALTGSVSAGARSPFDNPLLDTSGSRTGAVDFSGWYDVGPLNQMWVINDLAAILFGEGRIASEPDAPALWAEVVGDAS